MGGTHAAPEGMVDPVHAHVDHHEEVVAAAVEQSMAGGEALLGHRVDVPQDLILVVGAEVRHVDEELALDPPLDRRLQLGRYVYSLCAPGVRKQLTV